MATKRIKDINITIQVRGGVFVADASVEWFLPDLPEIPIQSVAFPLIVSTSDTIGSIVSRLDAATGGLISGGGAHTIETPTRP